MAKNYRKRSSIFWTTFAVLLVAIIASAVLAYFFNANFKSKVNETLKINQEQSTEATPGTNTDAEQSGTSSEDNQKLQSELDAKSEELATVTAEKQSLETKLSEANSKITLLTAEKQALELDLESATSDIETLTAEKQSLETQLSTSDGDKTELQAQLDLKTQELTQARADKQTLEKQLASKNEEINQLTSDKQSLESKLSEANATIQALESEKAELQSRIEELESSGSNARTYTTFSTEDVTFSGLSSFYGENVFIVGGNYYYIYDTTYYLLNEKSLTWEICGSRMYGEPNPFYIDGIWYCGENTYYSYGSTAKNYLLYVGEDNCLSFQEVTWTGLSSFYGFEVWNDGKTAYCGSYVLNEGTSTWEQVTWTEKTPIGDYVWNDGKNYFYNSYMIDTNTFTCYEKSWTGLTSLSGASIFNKGNNVYLLQSDIIYVLDKDRCIWVACFIENNASSINSSNIWIFNDTIFYSKGSIHYKIIITEG